MQGEIKLDKIKLDFDTSGMSTAEILNLVPVQVYINAIRVLDRKMDEIARKAYQDEIALLREENERLKERIKKPTSFRFLHERLGVSEEALQKRIAELKATPEYRELMEECGPKCKFCGKWVDHESEPCGREAVSSYGFRPEHITWDYWHIACEKENLKDAE